MKKCAKCGRQNDDRNMFCDSCGNVLSGESISTSSSNGDTFTSPQYSEPQSKPKSKPKISMKTVVVVIIVVVAIGGVAFFVFNLFANDPTNFDDDGQIHTNNVKMWEIGKDSKMRYVKEGNVGGHYKLIVTESDISKVNYRYQDKTTTGTSVSTEYSEDSSTRNYLSSLYSGKPVVYDGHQCYLHVEKNADYYVDVESGVPLCIDYGDYKLILKYCDLKRM